MKQLIITVFLLVIATQLRSQTADTAEGCAPLTVNFMAPDQTSYFWDFKDDASSVEKNPENVFTVASTYAVQLYTSQTSKSVELNVICPGGSEGYMPNTFTPNNDEVNDNFRPVLKPGLEDEARINVFRIYNRDGELVFDSNNPDGWNGVFNAEAAPPEVYAYYIELEVDGCNNTITTTKGNVTLIG